MVLRWLLALLIVTTLLGLYANEHWMTRRLLLDGRSLGQQLMAQSDSVNGGTSRVELAATPAGATMRCEIRLGYEWPFCELQVKLAKELDLRDFNRIRLWLFADGPTLDHSPAQVRVFLRNFDPAYAGSGAAVDLKPHEVVFSPGAQPVPVELRLSQFAVSSWWAQSHPLPVGLIGSQLDRVRIFSLSTGGKVVPGQHVIQLARAELIGTWVPPETFRLALVGLWMFSLLGYLAWESWSVRARLRRSQHGERALRRAHKELQKRSVGLEQLALRDPLTQVANREGLNRALDVLLQAQGELGFPLSVVFVDVDHFKRINDGHGHEVGDQVLVQLSQTLRANLPRDDLLARWGGEEFIVVMPQTPAEEAAAVAERLRQVLARTAWPAGLAVTASWGVAQADDEAGMDEAFRAADQAMYRAKRDGRDRVASSA